MAEIYLDNNATTRLLPEVRDAMCRSLEECWGNPSSPHGVGEQARERVEQAREAVASLVGAEPEEIVFTSGGTEANNLVLFGAIEHLEVKRLVTSAVEHASVLQAARALEQRGVDVVVVPVDREGRVEIGAIERSLAIGPALVSVQWVNNVTGVVQPVEEVARLCRRRGARFHVDAAQAVGKVAAHVGDLDFDYLTFTAHKFHGPKGVGALWRRKGAPLRPLFFGGEQEYRLRPGTENTIGIVGFGVAAALRKRRVGDVVGRMRRLRDRFEKRLCSLIDRLEVISSDAERCCNTSCVRFCGVDGQALRVQLEARGVYCSQRSACSDARPAPSHVFGALGLSEREAYECLRFSLSEETTEVEIEAAARRIADAWSCVREGMQRLVG
ncbi:MAG: cysteine desulfurase [Candidatus Dadabacteria bacterium]|nr:MAG: cysteine desulfurase [Candidatus Dadabacteria bacterium]